MFHKMSYKYNIYNTFKCVTKKVNVRGDRALKMKLSFIKKMNGFMLICLTLVFCSCATIFFEKSDASTNGSESIEIPTSTNDGANHSSETSMDEESDELSSSEGAKNEDEMTGNSSTQDSSSSGEGDTNEDSSQDSSSSGEGDEKTDVELPEVVLP